MGGSSKACGPSSEASLARRAGEHGTAPDSGHRQGDAGEPPAGQGAGTGLQALMQDAPAILTKGGSRGPDVLISQAP